MVVLNDRSQGGSSYWDGNIELMIQRWILTDDQWGLKDNLNETLPNGEGVWVLTRHIVEVGTIDDAWIIQRMQFEEPLQYFYS